MELLQNILQSIAALGIFNVWLIRFNKATPYRGGNASSMKEEFANYGLPKYSVYVIGFLKITAALGLLIGIFNHALTLPSALLLGGLMLGALGMHLRVRDPIKKYAPALSLLALCIAILLLCN
jgi:uncharacterized membrane protein YphA (DoxX/SURF4 family)